MSPVAPCEGAEIISWTMRLRLMLLGDDAPSGGNRFAFRSGHVVVGRLLFRGLGSLERFFEDELGRREI